MIEKPLNLHIPDATASPVGHFQMMGARSAALSQAYGRIVIISIFFAALYFIICIRAFDLMILQGALRSFNNEETGPQIVSTISTPRRDIVDRNGVLLATSIKTASLYADPHLIIDAEEAARGISRIFPEISYGETLQKLQSDKRFVWIKRNLTPTEQASVLELGQPGLAFQEEYRRLYPHGSLAAHMVGYSGVDGQGLSGIEQSFNNLLAKDGDDLALTMDIRLQHILRREIKKTITDFTAQGGAGLIMDIHTGEVLAAVSLPDFDPHVPAKANDLEKFNRVTLGTYELGSCFKIFTTAALLEQQDVSFSTTYDVRNPIRVGRFTISDYHPENRPLTVPEVFMHSSNIGTAMMAQQVGTDGLKKFFRELGFFDTVAFDIPEVGKPLVPNPWREVSTLTASYGHGIAVTPLHLAAATATIIGSGREITPRLVLDQTRMDQKQTKDKGDRVVSEMTVRKMRDLMRLVVKEGTGSKADVPGLLVGGKTGTAEKSINGRYVKKALISSFVGAFPMDNPRYLVMVSIDDPKPNKSSYGYATAGWTAAPAASRIIAGMAGVLGIVPDDSAEDPADKLSVYLPEEEKKSAATVKPVTQGGAVAALASVPE